MLARRTPLKRKTPLKAKKPWNRKQKAPREGFEPITSKKFAPRSKFTDKKRTPLKKVSRSQRRRLAEYYPIRAQYLEMYPLCEICIARGFHPPNMATEIHHARGRTKTLLCDPRFFRSSCRSCREWPHENPRHARELNLLCSPVEWNVPAPFPEK